MKYVFWCIKKRNQCGFELRQGFYSNAMHFKFLGSYQPNDRKCKCDLCQPGYFCNDTQSGGRTQCPPHSYCPEGFISFMFFALADYYNLEENNYAITKLLL